MVLYLILMVAIFVVAGVLFVYFSSKKQAITTDQILTARGQFPLVAGNAVFDCGADGCMGCCSARRKPL